MAGGDLTSDGPSSEVLREAVHWFVLFDSGEAGPEERARWSRWLEASEKHRVAWKQVEAVNDRLRSLPDATARMALEAPNQGRRRALKLLALAGCGTAALWAGATSGPATRWQADLHAGIGETRTHRLADGTRLRLNTGSAVDLHASRDGHRIDLLAGEILVESGPKTRELFVTTDHGRIQALGTRFAVRRHAGATDVSVFEGTVVLHPAGTPAAGRLDAGRRAMLAAAGIGRKERADPRRVAWARGRLVADGLRLETFLAELARYRAGIVRCAPELADLRLVGSYPLEDTDRILASLEAALPVRVEYYTPLWVQVVPV